MPLAPLDLRGAPARGLRRASQPRRNAPDPHRDPVRAELEPSAAIVAGNRPALRRLFVILLDNALKYSPAGGGSAAEAEPARTAASRLPSRIPAPASAATDLPHIFERFYRAGEGEGSTAPKVMAWAWPWPNTSRGCTAPPSKSAARKAPPGVSRILCGSVSTTATSANLQIRRDIVKCWNARIPSRKDGAHEIYSSTGLRRRPRRSLRAAPPTYKVISKIKIGGAGAWDYVYVDSANHRLYVSHGTQTEVIDTATDKVVGTIPGHQGRARHRHRRRSRQGLHQRRRRQRRHGFRHQNPQGSRQQDQDRHRIPIPSSMSR